MRPFVTFRFGYRVLCVVALCVGQLTACDVPVLRPNETGIGDASADASALGSPAGIVVAATDEVQSANIGIMDRDGSVLSQSVLSTASVPAGFSTALGGDLAFPSTPNLTAEITILDRYPSSVITWLDVSTARVRAQLSVATGFAANVHDYAQVSDTKAFVTRFDSNPNPGRQPFDAGGDLLVIDPSAAQITASIDIGSALPPQNGYSPHPDRARIINDKLYVVVPYYDKNHYSDVSYLAKFDAKTEQLEDHLLLNGLSGCSGLDVSPDSGSVAIACSGRWQGTSEAQPESSAIIGVTLAPLLRELWRVSALSTDARPFAFAVSFADSKHVLTSRLGNLGPPIVEDSIELIDITSGSVTTVLESVGQPVTLGVGPCTIAHAQCFVSDAGRNQVVRFDFDNGGGYAKAAFVWNDPVGLPPRVIGFFGFD